MRKSRKKDIKPNPLMEGDTNQYHLEVMGYIMERAYPAGQLEGKGSHDGYYDIVEFVTNAATVVNENFKVRKLGLVVSLENAKRKSGKIQSPKSLILFEEDTQKTTTIPLRCGVSASGIVRLGNETIFVKHPKAGSLLTKKIVQHLGEIIS